MVWEILEHFDNNDGIINLEFVDGKYISWDFALDSKFELCALFQQTEGETLEDFKKIGKRPVLYHKNLRTFHKVTEDEVYSYILYPAAIQENMLLIGNQIRKNRIYTKPKLGSIEITQATEREKRFLFFFKKTVLDKENYRINFKKSEEHNAIYYVLSDSAGQRKYSMSLSQDNATIYLKKDTEITFYMDENCRVKLEKEKI